MVIDQLWKKYLKALIGDLKIKPMKRFIKNKFGWKTSITKKKMKFTHSKNTLWTCKCLTKARGNIGFIYEATNGTGKSFTFESTENLPEHPIFIKLNEDFGFLEAWLMPDLTNFKITSSIFIHQEGEIETLEIVINDSILCAGHIINDKSALSFNVLGGSICIYNCL